MKTLVPDNKAIKIKSWPQEKEHWDKLIRLLEQIAVKGLE